MAIDPSAPVAVRVDRPAAQRAERPSRRADPKGFMGELPHLLAIGPDPHRGRLVRRLELDLVGGPQTVVWDGRDDAGALAPPGLYLCQVGARADAEAGRRKRSRVIALAY